MNGQRAPLACLLGSTFRVRLALRPDFFFRRWRVYSSNNQTDAASGLWTSMGFIWFRHVNIACDEVSLSTRADIYDFIIRREKTEILQFSMATWMLVQSPETGSKEIYICLSHISRNLSYGYNRTRCLIKFTVSSSRFTNTRCQQFVTFHKHDVNQKQLLLTFASVNACTTIYLYNFIQKHTAPYLPNTSIMLHCILSYNLSTALLLSSI